MIIAAHKPDANKNRTAALLESLKTGRVVRPKGEKHHQWKGGPLAYRKRAQESGKLNEFTRRYRKNNPHKVKEFAHTRKRRKYGRLPKGTISNLFTKQRGLCAICACELKKYDVDHIMPLAKGGKHERLNIQLLCRTCNVRKSAKDPIKYMQERGRLL